MIDDVKAQELANAVRTAAKHLERACDLARDAGLLVEIDFTDESPDQHANNIIRLDVEILRRL